MAQPVTERSNELCQQFDGGLSPQEFLHTLHAADAQVFGGFKGFPGLLSSECVDMVENAATGAARVLSSKSGQPGFVVGTGCGTSGRIAFLTARRYRRHDTGALGPFQYLCAGGDSALLLSDELPEDDPSLGVRDFTNLAASLGDDKINNKAYLIGITCGISAPYVAGQVAALMTAPEVGGGLSTSENGCALMGFNPEELARNTIIENCFPDGRAASCRQVVAEFLPKSQTEATGKHVLVNPVVGPEAVAGSSRMKGGTATLILLDAIYHRAIHMANLVGGERSPTPRMFHSGQGSSRILTDHPLSTAAVLAEYARVHASTYMAVGKKLPNIMAMAAKSIRARGNLYYLGIGSAGVMGFIDLSEMPDTYGGPFDQTRAFVHGGWKAVGNVSGDLASHSYLHRIGFDHFESDILPKMTRNDTVLFLVTQNLNGNDGETSTGVTAAESLLGAIREKTSNVGMLGVLGGDRNRGAMSQPLLNKLQTAIGSEEHVVQVDLTDSSSAAVSHHEGFTDLAMKIMLNAVSTYAQASGRGALFKGLMIAAGPANDKIYQRGVNMIASTVGVSTEAANLAMMKAIYGVDKVPDEILEKPRVEHIKAALLPEDQRHTAQLVLPVAFLVAIPGWTVEAARKAAAEEPQLSALLQRALEDDAAASGEKNKKKMNQPQSAILGVDLGGTNVRASVVASSGRLLSEVARSALEDRGSSKVLETVVSTIEAALKSYTENGEDGKDKVEIASIAVGQPGLPHEDGSISQLAAFPDWGAARVPLAWTIEQKFPTFKGKVKVFDDAESAAAGEVRFGAARLARTAVILTVGTGIGSALSTHSGQKSHTGARGLIELGHAVVPYPDGEAATCSCGQVGCLEVYASGSAIAKHSGCASAADTFTKAQAGDAKAVKVIDQAAQALASGFLNAIRAYDPDVIILCGGPLAEQLLPPTLKHLEKQQWTLYNDVADVAIGLASCPEAGIQGAAALGFQQHFQEEKNVDHGGDSSSTFSLRKSGPDDMAALYNVCLKTGDSGADGTHLFGIPSLLGEIYVGPYLIHSKRFAFALVEESQQQNCDGNSDASFGGVCGYVLGVLDTTDFNKIRDAEWWPTLKQKYPREETTSEERGTSSGTSVSRRPNEQELIEQQIYSLGGGTPAAIFAAGASFLEKFPSHMHIDMLPHAQGRGFGPVMVTRLLNALRAAGSTGVHLTLSSTNDRAFNFYLKLGFQLAFKGEEEFVMSLGL